MNASKFLVLSSALVALLALPAAVGCSAPSTDDATGADAPEVKAAPLTIEQGKTRFFAGTFTIALKDGPVDLAFEVSDIDWKKNTAVWNAKVTSKETQGVTNDVDKAMKIMLARCPGCSSFSAAGEHGRLVGLSIDSEELGSMEYSGIEVENLKLTSTSTSPKGNTKTSEGKDDGKSGGTGSCSIVCGGEIVSCKESITKSACNADSFDAIPRCPHEFAFKAGGTCAK